MSAAETTSNDGNGIPCHCVIAHPEKPKFLVIRHTDRWSPPTLQVPRRGALMYKPAVINQGMMSKYAFRTTVLRIARQAQNYALIELELHASSRRQMQAVWVGRQEYEQFRQEDTGDEDPLEQWLIDQERERVSPLRAPWERPGWYRVAEQWFSDRLIHLGIQARGSVQQFKAGWPTACILRVSTVQGQVFFKAAYDKPPGEARLTKYLCRHWPDLVAEPLAVDTERNWMVMRDFKLRKDNRPPLDSYPDFARALGHFQVEAMAHMDEWRSMKCPVMDLPFMCNDEGREQDLMDDALARLSMEPTVLEEDEIELFEEALRAARESCRKLAAFGLPDTLAHLDFRPDNVFFEDGKCRVLDWADVAITHPFMAMFQTLDFFERHGQTEEWREDIYSIDEQTVAAMQDAYLSAFEDLLPREKLEAAFETAQDVFSLFWFLYAASQARMIEPGTPRADGLNHMVSATARQMIERFSGRS